MVAKAQNIHSNMLQHSDLDMICLCDAVDHRFKKLCEMYFRVNHEPLFPPAHLDKDMMLWRTMFLRHDEKDFRHTEDEMKSVRRVAEWTLQEKCKLVNEEYVPLDWGDDK